MKINDYHRGVIARYYGKIYDKYGADMLIRHIPKFASIVWGEKGLKLAEKHLEKGFPK